MMVCGDGRFASEASGGGSRVPSLGSSGSRNVASTLDATLSVKSSPFCCDITWTRSISRNFLVSARSVSAFGICICWSWFDDASWGVFCSIYKTYSLT